MREFSDKKRLEEFMRALGESARQPARVYLTGGATAVLQGWRDSTVDIDLRFIPENDELFRALPVLKERLNINVELASPPDFIPEVPGWETRSLFIARVGKIDFFHFDPYSQALAKIERGHEQDVGDVASMLANGLIEKERVSKLFQQIEPQLYRYPAIDPAKFRTSLQAFLDSI